MHVGRAQSVPSGARIRATPAPSLRTSAVVLEDETFSVIGEEDGEGEGAEREGASGKEQYAEVGKEVDRT